jgi:hypothetical protein
VPNLVIDNPLATSLIVHMASVPDFQNVHGR